MTASFMLMLFLHVRFNSLSSLVLDREVALLGPYSVFYH